MTAVAMTRRADAKGKLAREQKDRILRRDGYRCVQCGRSNDLSIDHRQPVAKGGSDDDENLQVMCRECNGRKGDSEVAVPSKRAARKNWTRALREKGLL